jgi:hypothetical protein
MHVQIGGTNENQPVLTLYQQKVWLKVEARKALKMNVRCIYKI